MGLPLHDQRLQSPPHGLAQCFVDDLKVHGRVLLVQPPERAERHLHDREPMRAIAVNERRKDGQLDLALGGACVRDLGNSRRPKDDGLDVRSPKTKVDVLPSPAGHLGVRRDHQHHRVSALAGSNHRDVNRPGVLLVQIFGALNLEDDGQHHDARSIVQLEHEIGAKLDRDELLERRLDRSRNIIRRDLDVEQGCEEVRRKVGVLAEHLHKGVVLERRHR